MAISALGVGSGLPLEDLVKQFVQAERTPREQSIARRESENNVSISGFSKLKSELTKLLESLQTLGDSRELSARAATINGGGEEGNAFLSATAGSDAATASYAVSVEQLAQGSKAKSGAFTSSAEEITTTAGTLSFATADGSSSFDIDVGPNATLAEIADAVNSSTDNYGVSASIVNTGGTNPETRLIFSSKLTGAENELVVSNDNAELDRLSTVATGATAGMTIAEADKAQDAILNVDGITTYSKTNTFSDAIDGVEIVATKASPGVTQQLEIGTDTEGVREKIETFVEDYNSLMTQMNSLTRANPEGTSGALVGDSMVRGLMGSLSNIIGSAVGSADPGMNTLYSLGISLDAEGKLEFTEDGETRLTNALENEFDSVSKLFANEDGIGTKLDNLIEQYTQSGGLISNREDTFEQRKDDLADEKEDFARYMKSYETTLRGQYAALDSMLAQMNQTSDYLSTQLASLPGFGGKD